MQQKRRALLLKQQGWVKEEVNEITGKASELLQEGFSNM